MTWQENKIKENSNDSKNNYISIFHETDRPTENEFSEWYNTIGEAFNEIFGTQINPHMLEDGYLCYSYSDKEGRYAEDVRLYHRKNPDNPKSLSLNVNVGPDTLVLLEIQQRFQEKGIMISLLGSNEATTEEWEILKQHSPDRKK